MLSSESLSPSLWYLPQTLIPFRTNIFSKNNFITIVIENGEIAHPVFSIFKSGFYLGFVFDGFPKFIHVLHVNVNASGKERFRKKFFFVVWVFAIFGLILWQYKHDAHLLSCQVNKVGKVLVAFKT